MKSIIDKVALIYLHNKRILHTRSKGRDVFYLPGGEREKGESDVQTLMREVREEMQVELIPDSMSFVGKFRAQAHGKPKGTIVQITCYMAGFKGDPVPDSEVEEIAWLAYEDKEKTSLVDQLLFDHLREKGLL